MDKYKHFFEQIKQVFGFFQDDISKGIYRNVICANSMGEIQTIPKEYISMGLQKELDKLKEQIYRGMGTYEITSDWKVSMAHQFSQSETIVIYGAGIVGRSILKLLHSFNHIIFCDNIFHGNKIEGIDVITEEEMIQNYKNSYFIIASLAYSRILREFLLNHQIPLNRIIMPSSGMHDKNQYFDFFHPEEKEIFIDAGAYRGETSIQFAQWANSSFEKVYVLEPDHKNLIIAKENLMNSQIKNYELIDKGLWNCKEILKFSNDGTSSSSITESGDLEVKVDALDNILKGDKVTYIKMDIEGAELKALEGCRETILKYKPKLAICVYHKPEDIIEIPSYIKSLVPEYKLYLRHYSLRMEETVLYACL